MKLLIIFVSVTLLLLCNERDEPTKATHNYYDDLKKGTVENFTHNEKQIITEIISSAMLGDIALIGDSTLTGDVDTNSIHPNDTFPLQLGKKFSEVNSNRHYIGNSDPGIAQDYRYFPSREFDSLYPTPFIAWSELQVRYPKSIGFIFFSKPVLDDDSTQALILVQYLYPAAKERRLVSLSKINGIWYRIHSIRTSFSGAD